MQPDATVTVNIKNFEGRTVCPYCGKRPFEIEWSKEGLKIWCKNPECSWLKDKNNEDGSVCKIFTPIYPEELNLVKVTNELLDKWAEHCRNNKRRGNYIRHRELEKAEI